MAGETTDGATGPRDPDGEVLGPSRRLTRRRARSWVRRDGVLLGRWGCRPEIDWPTGADRDALVEDLRGASGGDCRPDGDVLLYRLADGRPVLVLEEPW